MVLYNIRLAFANTLPAELASLRDSKCKPVACIYRSAQHCVLLPVYKPRSLIVMVRKKICLAVSLALFGMVSTLRYLHVAQNHEFNRVDHRMATPAGCVERLVSTFPLVISRAAYTSRDAASTLHLLWLPQVEERRKWRTSFWQFVLEMQTFQGNGSDL